ncbi:hypothetical protein FOZ63_010476, partial [Perkinsus olseni]
MLEFSHNVDGLWEYSRLQRRRWRRFSGLNMAEAPPGDTSGKSQSDGGGGHGSVASGPTSDPAAVSGILYFNFVDTRMGPAASPKEGK